MAGRGSPRGEAPGGGRGRGAPRHPSRHMIAGLEEHARPIHVLHEHRAPQRRVDRAGCVGPQSLLCRRDGRVEAAAGSLGQTLLRLGRTPRVLDFHTSKTRGAHANDLSLRCGARSGSRSRARSGSVGRQRRDGLPPDAKRSCADIGRTMFRSRTATTSCHRRRWACGARPRRTVNPRNERGCTFPMWGPLRRKRVRRSHVTRADGRIMAARSWAGGRR